jgi:murein L,D-transpeptidase YcbB/YkuD
MAGDSNKAKKGFSGLINLASDVSGIDWPIKPEQKADANPPTPKQPLQLDSWGDWHAGIIGIFFVIFVICVINYATQSSKKPSYTPSSSSQSYNSAGPQYTMPSVGTNNVLKIAEIRWCVREDIRIKAMRDVINSKTGLDEFNRIIKDYNSRCVSYQYLEDSQSRAERDVEAYRSQIVSEAIREARQLEQSSNPSDSSGVSTSAAPKKPNAQYTREAQQLLTALGYNPGPVDGVYGRKTANAVKAFQRDAGVTQDGWVDEDLLGTLRKAKAAN